MAKFASRLLFGDQAVDWDERINYARMRKERLEKAKLSLKKNGVAVCLLARPENVRYLTSTKAIDFIDQMRYTLTFTERDPILYEMRGGRSHGSSSWIKPENVRLATQWANEACGRDATWDMAKKFARILKGALKEEGLEKEKLGIDKLDEPAHQALKEAGIETFDAMPVMLEARATKTEDEVNCLKMAASIADIGWSALYQTLKPGVRARELVGAATQAMFNAGAEDIFIVGVMIGGSKASSKDKIVQVGDMVTTDFARVNYMGYNTCYYRNIIVGRKPTEKEKDMQKKIYERIYRVIDTIKPGATTADAAKHWVTAEYQGAPSEEHVWCEDLGHGIGLWLYEYPIINRLWSLDYPMKFEKGMTIAIEAIEKDPDIGLMKLEEMVVVTDSGAEIITRMPIKDIMIASPIHIAD